MKHSKDAQRTDAGNGTKTHLPAVYCPECGHETVIEDIKWFYGTVKTERCDGLIEVSSDKPLEACTWSQELG